jgi:hypothetical protein
VGRLFHEFAITLAVTIVFSAIVSLTLVPMMCARLLRHRPVSQRWRIDVAAERGFNWIIGRYDQALNMVLDHQPLDPAGRADYPWLDGVAVHCAAKGLLPRAGYRVRPGHIGGAADHLLFCHGHAAAGVGGRDR